MGKADTQGSANTQPRWSRVYTRALMRTPSSSLFTFGQENLQGHKRRVNCPKRDHRYRYHKSSHHRITKTRLSDGRIWPDRFEAVQVFCLMHRHEQYPNRIPDQFGPKREKLGRSEFWVGTPDYQQCSKKKNCYGPRDCTYEVVCKSQVWGRVPIRFILFLRIIAHLFYSIPVFIYGSSSWDGDKAVPPFALLQYQTPDVFVFEVKKLSIGKKIFDTIHGHHWTALAR